MERGFIDGDLVADELFQSRCRDLVDGKRRLPLQP